MARHSKIHNQRNTYSQSEHLVNISQYKNHRERLLLLNTLINFTSLDPQQTELLFRTHITLFHNFDTSSRVLSTHVWYHAILILQKSQTTSFDFDSKKLDVDWFPHKDPWSRLSRVNRRNRKHVRAFTFTTIPWGLEHIRFQSFLTWLTYASDPEKWPKLVKKILLKAYKSPYADLPQEIKTWMNEHPYQIIFRIDGKNVLFYPYIIDVPILWSLGWTATGPKTGSQPLHLHTHL